MPPRERKPPTVAEPNPVGPAAEPVVTATAAVTSETTAVLRGDPAPAPPAPRRRIRMSEGLREDLRRQGKVTEPSTGYELRIDRRTGAVTAYDRATGQPVTSVAVTPAEMSARGG